METTSGVLSKPAESNKFFWHIAKKHKTATAHFSGLNSGPKMWMQEVSNKCTGVYLGDLGLKSTFQEACTREDLLSPPVVTP